MHRASIWDYKKWDFENKTVSDFTIQVRISEKMWANYQMRCKMDENTPKLDKYVI